MADAPWMVPERRMQTVDSKSSLVLFIASPRHVGNGFRRQGRIGLDDAWQWRKNDEKAVHAPEIIPF